LVAVVLQGNVGFHFEFFHTVFKVFFFGAGGRVGLFGSLAMLWKSMRAASDG